MKILNSRQHLKNRIINNNLIKYKCRECGNDGKWNNKKLSLHLEHINGVNNDNRLLNLTFLCPNCHSQTETYGGKGKKKVSKIKKCKCGVEIFKTSEICINCNSIKNRKVKNRPNFEELVSDIKKLGYSATGRKYGVSDNSIRKWENKYRNEN